MKLIKNIGWYSLSQVISVVVPILVIPIIISYIGVDGYGELAFIQAKIAVLTIISNYGFELSAPRWIISGKVCEQKVYATIQQVKISLYFISALIFFVMFGFSFLNVVMVLYGLSVIALPNWYYLSKQKAKTLATLNAISKFFYLLLILAVFKIKPEIEVIALCLAVSSFGVALYSNLKNIPNLAVLFVVDVNLAKKLIVDGFSFFKSRVAISLYTNMNIIVLGFFGSDFVVGIYTVAEKIYQAIQGLYRPIVNAVYPFLLQDFSIAIYRKIFTILNVVNVIGVLFCYIYSSLIVSWFDKVNTGEIVEIFNVFLLCILILLPSILLGHPYLGAKGKSKFVNDSIVIAAAFHLVMLFLLSVFNLVNAYNIATLVLVTESTVLILRTYKIWRKHA
ncbi:oligosaccharide flippase family protein [Vibrio natriegens]|uniref:oligosaccharide flippase family protein n=1 Tax=Vibrio natriegens TaxID=691 RepID=UPI00390ABB47